MTKKILYSLIGLFFAIPAVLAVFAFHNSREIVQHSYFEIQVLFKSEFHTQSYVHQLHQHPGVVSLKRFDNYPSKFFERLYDVTITSTEVADSLKSLSYIEGIHIPQKLKLTSVYPAKLTQSQFSDSYFNFQWALENVYVPGDEKIKTTPENNRGHLLRQDISDVEVEFISSLPADGGTEPYSINFGPIAKQIAHSPSEEKIVIAVIDTGIDWNHPDLQNSLYKKEVECPEGQIPPPIEDKDGNGYHGDCLGWNFTEARVSRGRNRPFDIVGHGTHISGILAAGIDNEIGTTGLSSRIQIMPLKVIGSGSDLKDQNEEFSADQFDGFTSQMAKAIRYATHEGAQVINLSLGWPRVSNVDIVKEAIQEALEHNVAIIAASGNDGHSSRILPCATTGVICVGAINNDGTVTTFSNHGGHVDVLAPGMGILSSFTSRRTPHSFDVSNYEIFNGTSQAAPFVSGLVALMKLETPNISFNEIRARLIKSSRPVFDRSRTDNTFKPNKKALGGAIQMDEALSLEPTSVIVPHLKNVGLLGFNESTSLAEIQFSLENLWLKSTNVVVELKSLSPGVKFTQQQFWISELPEDSIHPIETQLKVEDSWTNSLLDFEVTIKSDQEESKTYWHSAQISRQLQIGQNVIKVPRPERQPGTFSQRPVNDFRGILNQPTLYTTKVIEDEGIEVELFQVTDTPELVSLGKKLIPNMHLAPQGLQGPTLQIYAEYLDSDNRPDFLISGLYSREEKPIQQLSYFNSQFQPLYGSKSHMEVELKYGQPALARFSLMHFQVSGVGSVATPVFVAQGYTPEQDLPGLFEFFDPTTQSNGIYTFKPYVENGTLKGKERKLDAYDADKILRGKLGLRDVDSLHLIGVLNQSAADSKLGKTTAFYSYGRPNRGLYAYSTIGNSTLRTRSSQVKTVQMRHQLMGNQLLPVTELSGTRPKKLNSTMFFANYQQKAVRAKTLLNASKNRWSPSVKYFTEGRGELVHKAIRAFQKGKKNWSVFETGTNVIAMLSTNDNPDPKIFKHKVIRSTFLLGQFFTEILQPTFIKTDQGLDPALYIDASRILSGNFFMWHLGEDKAVVPIQLNVLIPPQCRTIDKMYWNKYGADTVILDCSTDDETYFLLVPFVR